MQDIKRISVDRQLMEHRRKTSENKTLRWGIKEEVTGSRRIKAGAV